MTKRLQMSAFALVLLLSCPLFASVVTLDMTVNDGNSLVTIDVGETVFVQVYATVTENSDLGLAGYGVGVLSDGGVLSPVQSGGQWDALYYVPALVLQTPGNVTGDDVLGHGAALMSFVSANTAIAANLKTLLASGYFEGVAPGTTNLALGGENAANVVWYDSANAKYIAVPATSILLTGGAAVMVTPEPATLVLLAVGLAAVVKRRRAARPSRA